MHPTSFCTSPRIGPRTACLLALLALTSPSLAGPLEPPAGPITSTHKTLSEIEPRTPLSITTTPGDANSLFRITQSGSYYLTGNVTVSGPFAAIELAAADITIDLNGFTITGAGGATLGVRGGGVARATIRNGTFRNFASGGVDLGSSDSCVIHRVTVEGCGGVGISAGSRAIVTECIARGNSVRGINVNVYSLVRDSVATGNTGDGILVGSGAQAINCIAASNTGDGFTTNDGAVITNCVATANGGDGFDVSFGITITGSTANSNAEHGFSFGAFCLLEGNSTRSNGTSSTFTGAGYASGATGSSTLRNNSARQNEIGFDIDGTGNLLVGNSAGASSVVNYQIVANNRVAQIVVMAASAAINGNTGGVALPTPDANLAY